MEDQLTVVNTVLGIVVAIFAIYEFIAKVRKAKSFDKKAAWMVFASLALIGVALYLFLYKPIVPNESSEIVLTEEGSTPAVEPQQPTYISKEYLLDETNSTHKGFSATSRRYTRVFTAEPGHRIVDYEWVPTSVNNASNLSFNIRDNGAEVVVTFILKAGPVFDRWRGWLKGRLVTRQEVQ